MPGAKKNADGLTKQQKAFALYMAQTGDEKESAIQAGYPESSADTRAYENMQLPHVLAEIEKHFDKTLRKRGIQGIKRLAKLMDSATSESVRLQAAAKLAERGGAQVKPRKTEEISGLTAEQILKKFSELQEEIRQLVVQIAKPPGNTPISQDIPKPDTKPLILN